MQFLLDTNTCIFIIKRQPPVVLKKFLEYQIGDIGISSITLSELRYGVAKSEYKKKNAAALDEFILPLEIFPYDEQVTAIYGNIRADLEKSGRPIGAMDMLIAAHAISLNATLVTNNTREFKRVHGLNITDWTG